MHFSKYKHFFLLNKPLFYLLIFFLEFTLKYLELLVDLSMVYLFRFSLNMGVYK